MRPPRWDHCGAQRSRLRRRLFVLDEAEMILAMLGLIDAALVASLIGMEMIFRLREFRQPFRRGQRCGQPGFLPW
ncbi:hypothetical protein REMIM1_CH03126 [Rhizobium etli bv. mimosae str. Mim1]|nr:hypothetical protein REMIM1_CH03126 [Rhizobium etli bv. mimosae str. Mim1]